MGDGIVIKTIPHFLFCTKLHGVLEQHVYTHNYECTYTASPPRTWYLGSWVCCAQNSQILKVEWKKFAIVDFAVG